MKLKESIPSNGVKIIELYNKINSDLLETRPSFQRKLVWKKQHKYHFIETILFNFPFPEVYIASAEIDVENLTTKEIVVDGQQRLCAIVDYIKGINDFENQKKIKSFDALTTDEKKEFLNYLVSVRDLKDMNPETIKKIFERINSTEYSLNAVENINAQYGDSEFMVFCKQIVDDTYNPNENDTDVVIDKKDKLKFNAFFSKNNIFTDNDRSRMLDIQYIMLIISTLMEQNYYGRSAKIEEYLEKYNNAFSEFKTPMKLLTNSIDILNKVQLNTDSYWFHKPNLFNLIFELSNINESQMNFEKLERKLLEMEDKSDDYFSEINLENISSDEKKYFEVSRQGSNERASRIHRGKIVTEMIQSSLKEVGTTSQETTEVKRLRLLSESHLNYVTIEPTKTNLVKSIIDATSSVRKFLKLNNIHDYESQEYGADRKISLNAKFVLKDILKDVDISLYRANHRGDARISISGLNALCKPNNIIALIYKNKQLYILNISDLSIEELIKTSSPLSSLIK